MNFRVARHTDNLEPIIKFYRDLLGLEVIGEFTNHDKYDGVFIGKEGLNWHLGLSSVQSKNPYWNNNGSTYIDPDGFRIVIAIMKK